MPDKKTSKAAPEIDIPGYTVVKQLGRGGMANVYLAIQESIDREVALKVMLPALMADKSFSERFLREARIAAKLSHPNIVSVFDVGVSERHHYISMEYHPGGDFKARIKKGVGIKKTLSVIKEIASALDFAQKKGFVHRDIKPENILFSQTGAAVLADFGIARAQDVASHLTATGSIIGTPHYMSPEQAQGKKVDGRSDLYSLGIVFYQALCGCVPFEGDSALSIGIKHIRDPVPRLPKKMERYQSFIDKLLAKGPEDRWQSGADVVRMLETLEMDGSAPADATLQPTVVSGAVTTGGTEIINTGSLPAQRSGRGWLMVGLALVAVVSAGGYFLFQQKPETIAQQPATEGIAESGGPVDRTQTKLVAKLQSLLKGARRDMAARRYRTPAGKNALEKYRTAIAIDVNNRQAKAGLRKISDIHIGKTTELIARNSFSLAQQQLDLAADADFANPALKKTRVKLASAKDAEHQARERTRLKELARKKNVLEKQRKLEKSRLATEKKREADKKRKERLRTLANHLNRADQYLSPSRLSESRVGNAYDQYRAAARISPKNRKVKKLPLRIANSYQALAENARARKQWERAKRLANKGLTVYPNHNKLYAVIDRVNQEQNQQPEKKTRRRSFGGF